MTASRAPATVSAHVEADPGALSAALRPRDDIVAEAEAGPGRFAMREGPFTEYERVVEVHDEHAGTFTTTTRYRLAIPWFGWLFALPVRAALRHPRPQGAGMPWWAPPDRLDARAAGVLGVLAALSVIAGYVNTLFTQTVSFAADEFGVGSGGQGVALAVVRSGIVVALLFSALADRRGRRIALIAAAVLAPFLSALGALAPNLAILTASQALGRPVGLALLLLVAVVAAEEVPARTRAYAVSIIGMATALGAGMCVAALPLADLGPRAWRLVYLVTLTFWALVPAVRRLLPESRRFTAQHATTTRVRDHRGRFWMLASAGVLRNLLNAPSSGFQNRYLTEVRGYSATMITVFTIVTVTPAAVSLIVGGKLADLHGRRLVGAVGLGFSTLGIVLAFFASGWQLWWWSFFAALAGGLSVPALGVYGAELFPTGSRGRAGGWLTVLSLVGSSAGLLAAGWLIDRLGSYGWSMAVLAVGPAIAVVLVLTLFPETAGEELEDLNPEDRTA